MAFSNHDVVPDSPINNFCTLNPLAKTLNPATFSNGNLKITTPNSGGGLSLGSIAIPFTGKWYMECRLDSPLTSIFIGLCEYLATESYGWNSTTLQSVFYSANYNGRKYLDGVYSAYGEGYTTGDVIGLEVDSAGSITFYKNNISQGSISKAVAGLFFAVADGSSSFNAEYSVNFGQDPTFGGATSLPAGAGDYDTDTAGASTGGRFAFQPPAGALALCTQNLPEGPIKLSQDETPSDNFKAVKYTGNGTGQSITGVGFQPDLIWAKSRSSATSHALADSVRGPRKILGSNNTTSEYSETSGTTLLSFDSDGFTVGTDGNYTAFTSNNSSIVAWCWKAAGSPADNQAKIINEDGSAMDATAAEAVRNSGSIVPSKISANRQNGFSIVKYTGNDTDGASLPHGLNQRPDFFIIKNLTKSAGDNWIVASVGDFNISNNIGDGHLVLNSTNQADGHSGFFT